MRSFLVTLIFLTSVAAAWLLMAPGEELPKEFPTGIIAIEFETSRLPGGWEGPGLIYFAGDSGQAMTVDAHMLISTAEGDNSFVTSLTVSGHEYQYADSGSLLIGSDKVSWDIWDDRGKHMASRGLLRNNILWLKFDTPQYQYRHFLHFSSPDRIYLRIELYREGLRNNWLRNNWMEFTLSRNDYNPGLSQ